MFLIVAHHYVVNSTAMAQFTTFGGSLDIPSNYAFLTWFGAWGKSMINPFIMISGYFMCTGNLTIRRYLKIFLEWIFYAWTIYLVFLLCGRETGSVRRIFNVIFPFFKGVDLGFMPSFCWFYAGVPVYNIVIRGLDRKGLFTLTSALLLMFVVPLSFFGNTNVFHHVFWYMTLYFVGACVRLYPFGWMEKFGKGFAVCLFLSVGLIASWYVFCGKLPYWRSLQECGCISPYESSTLFSFVVGFTFFLFFKNLRIGSHAWINRIAPCMFGVLLIHASSNAMRCWLWQDICRVPEMAYASVWRLVVHALLCVVVIMTACTLIDLLRQRFIERPLFERLLCKKEGE